MPPFSDLDISRHAFWSQTFEEREPTFAKLRATGGLTWHEPMETDFPHTEPGFWAATRHEDIRYISKNHEIFSSAQGVALSAIPAAAQAPTTFFLMMDPPQHTQFRRLISSAFTPKRVANLEQKISAGAREIVDDLIGAGDIDFVEACAAILPMRTVSDMVGIAPGDRPAVAKAAFDLFAGPSEEDAAAGIDFMTFFQTQVAILRAAAIETARDRRRHPRDDLMTGIVEAEVDGQRLSDDDIGAFMVLLTSAGFDTTKQTTSNAIWALSRHPDERRWLLDDFDARIAIAIDEFVRYASPVLSFTRTATIDTEMNGVQVSAGDKVAMFYGSGNRDESVFARPHDFIASRSPNPHVAFGGGGVHFCLGSSVARMELRAIFKELLTRVPDIEVGEPEWLLPNHFVHGIERLPVRIS